MNLVRVLRLFVLVDIVLYVSAVALSPLLVGFLPEQLRVYLDELHASPTAIPDLIASAFDIVWVVVTAVAWVGLWRFWKLAPTLYLILYIGGLLLLPFLGPTVQTV